MALYSIKLEYVFMAQGQIYVLLLLYNVAQVN